MGAGVRGGASIRGRHVAVIEAASRGLLNREIAVQLCYSRRTVEGLIDEARSWLAARNRPHVVARAVSEGLIPSRDPAGLERLTPRQRELAEAIARGRTVAEAARELGISSHTAMAHIRRARHATGSATSAALAALIASRDALAAERTPGAALPRDARVGYRLLLALLQEGRVEEAIRRLRLVVPERRVRGPPAEEA